MPVGFADGFFSLGFGVGRGFIVCFELLTSFDEPASLAEELEHSGLGKRECYEDAESVEGNEGVGIGLIDDDEKHRQQSENDNSVLEHESVADGHELAREIAVASDKTAETREISECGVCSEEEDSCSHEHDC